MILELPPTSDLDAIRGTTRSTLGLPLEVRPAPEDTRDLGTALQVIQIPFTLLATWDLAERLGLLNRVRGWLDALRALPGAEDATLRLPGLGGRPLSAITAGQILDAAAAAAPTQGPETLDWDVFIIHAGADRAQARQLYEALSLAGVQVYLDKARLRPSDRWPTRLVEAMRRTRVFLVLVSSHWDEGWYNDDEVARAISLARAGEGRVILPVDLEPERTPTHDLPYGTAHLEPVRIGSLPAATADQQVVEAVRDAFTS